MGRLRVQHCVVNQTTRQYGTNPTSDLLGVDYIYSVPADTEFPDLIGKLELFVRFFDDKPISGNVLITVVQLDPNGFDRSMIYNKPFALAPRTKPPLEFLDRSFKLMNVRLPAEGLYAIRVSRCTKAEPWQGKRWRVLATEYVFVQRNP